MSKREQREVPLWEHLTELGKRIKVVIVSVFVATAAMMVIPSSLTALTDPFSFYDPLIGLILRSIKSYIDPKGEISLIGYEITAPIELYVMSSLVFGLAISMPLIAYQFYKFIDPALHSHEKRAVYPFVISTTLLFTGGAIFGFFVITPFMIWATIPFFRLAGILPVISVMDFYNLIFITTIITGAIFTFPVFFVLLVKFGIIESSIISKNRKYFYAGLYIITALITPDGGPLADMALFVPMIILTEVAILVSRRYEKGQKESERPQNFLTRILNPEPPRCRFCHSPTSQESVYCPKCERSQL